MTVVEMTKTSRAAVFAVSWIGGLSGHETGDYAVQRDCDAITKQARTADGHSTPEGRRALLIHGVTYGAAQLVSKRLAYRAAGQRVPLLADLAGTLVEIAVHIVVDDGRLLAAFANSTGKGRFHDLGAPRPITGVVDLDGDIHPVHLVETELDAEGRRAPKVELDERGEVVDAVKTWDNPSPATGRALMDQATHKGLQLLLGAAVTTGVAAWLARRR